MNLMQINKPFLSKLILPSIASIAIGIIFLLAYEPKAILNPMALLYNSGYSLMLGLGLFLNGPVFRLFDKHYSWLKHPLKSVIISVVVTIIYSTIVIVFTNWLWYIYIYKISIPEFWKFGKTIIIWEYVILYIMSSVFYARSFLNQWRNNAIEKEKLKNQALALQYETLSNQVNPHFLFNSLNVLLSLIDQNKNDAKRFTEHLSSFYRQLLSLKDKQLIAVKEELDILRNYLELQQIRYGNHLDVNMSIFDDDNYYIIPLTLQMLVENALKHNILTPEHPLQLSIVAHNDVLIVRNNLQLRKHVVGHSQIGLKNLTERYLFLTNKNILVTQTDNAFEVQIPLITEEQ